ncbi:MAG: hypothetical protein ACRD8Z_02995 [Nitrososphaeraceae archaeon]
MDELVMALGRQERISKGRLVKDSSLLLLPLVYKRREYVPIADPEFAPLFSTIVAS